VDADDPIRRWGDACKKAMDLLEADDPLRAQCLILRDYAQLYKGARENDARKFADDAEAILKLDAALQGKIKETEPSTIAGAHFLIGYFEYSLALKAGRERDAGAEERHLTRALREFSDAIKQVESNDLYRDLPPLYMYRSRASVYFVNRIVLKDDTKRQLLEQAAEDARKALRFFDVNDRELAKFYVARGVALEDIAMLVEKDAQKKADRYREAVSMFRSAIENDKRSTRKVKARYRISLARCEYRAGDAAKARGTQDVRRALDEAEQNLKG